MQLLSRGGDIIATGVNRVTDSCDPTAHAEVMAIRNACQSLGTHDLTGCTLYTSCEPCPMCLGAIYWAHLDAVYYAANRVDAADVDFDDAFIYKEVPLLPEKRSLPFRHLPLTNATAPFKLWARHTDKITY
ncbi:tRNA-specific adenosine deaminase [Pullulanibacillus camelliae]|uniref:tRNA-specific adenosine deaminase n=1 Tax=Pullulanibacillus camelliae TaxID=1707096 RepID=A0A8J2VN88_9BACL|nr:tRNA-specific adenosine deaminase [Pullulanibacillus camelliae]